MAQRHRRPCAATRRGGALVLALSVTAFLCAPAVAGPGTRSVKTPDLEGVWSFNSITTLERPQGLTTLELTGAQAAAYEAAHPGTPETARASGVGQDESEWWETGGKLGRLDGKARSSWIVDPADGRLPFSAAGLKALAAAQAMASWFDGPEIRPAPERCLMGLGGSSLPPMLNTGYGALLRIVQTPSHVVILTEMNVGPRIIPLLTEPQEPGPAWNGRAVGRWTGSTLVVETTGFHPAALWRVPNRLLVSPTGKVTERFTREGPDTIRYAFTVDDPTLYTQAWTGEMPLNRTPKPMFEFACHEGNYSLSGILAGARQAERERAVAKPEP